MTKAQDEWGAFVDRREQAAVADGPLSGLRLAVKDNIAVAGLGWTAGLPLLAGRVAERDAACVALLRAAGAHIVGTVATDSAGFGMMTPGVANPAAPGRTAGGSSGGSAAAVAAGLADLALGTDTAGSVRVPAACCGVLGLKPTRGRVSTDGVTPLSWTFDHVGLLARSLAVLARGTEALLGPPPAPSVVRRIGYEPRRLAEAEPAIAAAVADVLARLRAEGFEIAEVELPDRDALAEAHGIIVCREALESWAGHWPAEADRFSDTARRSLAYAATIPAEAAAAAAACIARGLVEIDRPFGQADVIVSPTIDVAPPPQGARRVRLGAAEVPVVRALMAQTCLWNISGHPALAMPLPAGPDGWPPSLQIVARRDRDHDALAAAGDIGRLLAR